MSKRFIFPQQSGERKKARLDITISDHNFPLSQNVGNNKESDQADTWGDDNDDEILLLASQACEQAYINNDITSLPDYSLCMQPTSTSTQIFDQPRPSTSKSPFTFKKPTTNPPSAVPSDLKHNYNRISSPLPGMSSKVLPKVAQHVNVSDDLIFNDKIYKGQDADQVYRQLLQLQEENVKLKSENGKLLEKCVTKEGEASILRTQLKSCQVAVDNARLERIKAQEKVQMEWTEKLAAANTQMHDLRTQLDFKNLEIISIKEKCKKLESNKIKLTQVTVTGNDISSSHRNNNNINSSNDFMSSQVRRAKTISNGVQTDSKAHLLKLNKTCTFNKTNLSQILPIILEPTEEEHRLLEYNEKLQKHADISQYKCRVYSTFHRIPSTPRAKEQGAKKITLDSIYKDLTSIAEGDADKQDDYFNLFRTTKSVLLETCNELETVCQRVTNAFQKEMDERYIEATSVYLVIDKLDLLSGRAFYKEEQAILARRMTAVLAYVLETSRSIEIFKRFEESSRSNTEHSILKYTDVISRLCSLIDSSSCAILYSGLLLSIVYLLNNLTRHATIIPNTSLYEIMKNLLSCRPMAFVSCQLFSLLRPMALMDNFLKTFCPGSSVGNLKTDYDQGVLLYKKDSCYLQIFVKQVESSLKCMDKQSLCTQVTKLAQHLIALYSNMNINFNTAQEQSRCDCQLILIQVIVYALRICAVMLQKSRNISTVSPPQELLGVCRSGVQILYQCVLRDVEFSSQLSHNEGHLIELCEIMKQYDHSEVYGNMLLELTSTLQSSPEDMPPSFHQAPWLNSFKTFSLAD